MIRKLPGHPQKNCAGFKFQILIKKVALRIGHGDVIEKGLFLRFLASSVPFPPVALMIPII